MKDSTEAEAGNATIPSRYLRDMEATLDRLVTEKRAMRTALETIVSYHEARNGHAASYCAVCGGGFPCLTRQWAEETLDALDGQ